jgi:fatty acid desaturase
VIEPVERRAEAAAMTKRLASLRYWQLLACLLALATAVALAAWWLVWALWTIRPILTAGSALAAVGWTLHCLYRHRRSEEWTGKEWIGS